MKKKIIIMMILMLSVFFTGCGNTAHEELSNECIRLGYENLTDYTSERRFDGVLVVQIECDYEVLWTNCYNQDYGEYDKWGNYKVLGDTWECNK